MQTQSDDALVRSTLYRAFAIAFGPHSDELGARLGTREGWAHFQTALSAADIETSFDPPPVTDDLESHAVRLFGHVIRGDVTPYETEYGTNTLFQQPQELADLAGFYAAFGLVVAPDSAERVDHLRCECEFMAFLAAKEAYALESGDLDTAGEVRRAQRMFLIAHLGRFAPAFARRVQRADPDGFYGVMGGLLGRFVERESLTFGIESGSEELGLRVAAPEDDAPMACGPGGCEEGCPV